VKIVYDELESAFSDKMTAQQALDDAVAGGTRNCGSLKKPASRIR